MKTLRRLAPLAVVVAAAIALVTGVQAQPAPALLFSHGCTMPGGEAELHFILAHSPDTSYAGTAAAYEVAFDGGAPFTGSAPFVTRTGDTAHFADYPAAAPASIEVITATLDLAGAVYPLNNPGTFHAYPCAPTAVTLASLSAAAPGGCYCNKSSGYYECWRKTRWVKLWRCSR
jgi:hypothetical protein